jgi:hypothetical protein
MLRRRRKELELIKDRESNPEPCLWQQLGTLNGAGREEAGQRSKISGTMSTREDRVAKKRGVRPPRMNEPMMPSASDSLFPACRRPPRRHHAAIRPTARISAIQIRINQPSINTPFSMHDVNEIPAILLSASNIPSQNHARQARSAVAQNFAIPNVFKTPLCLYSSRLHHPLFFRESLA